MNLNYDEIKKLIGEMGNANIEELNIEFPEGMKINMKKNIDNITISKPEYINVDIIENKKIIDDYKTINSPMVGTFYESSSPNTEPFVKIGDRVKKGQVLCIIEAMKLMNEIESEYDGEIIDICINNEGIVEYGMPLFKIR